MKKPLYVDYGLNSDDEQFYKKMEKEYVETCDEKIIRHAKTCNGWGIALWIISIVGIYVVAMVAVMDDYSTAGTAACVILLIVFVALLAFGVMLLFSGFQKRILRLPDRKEYLDSVLDKKFSAYNADMCKYNAHVRELNIKHWESMDTDAATNEIISLFQRSGYSVGRGRVYMIVSGQWDSFAVKVGTVGKKVYGREVSRFINSIRPSERVFKIVYISIDGYNLFSTDTSRLATRKYFTLDLWDVDNVIRLADSVGALVRDADDVQIFPHDPFADPFDDLYSAKAGEMDADRRGTYGTSSTVKTGAANATQGGNGLYIADDPRTVFDMTVGERVIHTAFGEGVIDEKDAAKRTIIVRFVDDMGDEFRKKFVVPEAFDDGTLTMASDSRAE